MAKKKWNEDTELLDLFEFLVEALEANDYKKASETEDYIADYLSTKKTRYLIGRTAVKQPTISKLANGKGPYFIGYYSNGRIQYYDR